MNELQPDPFYDFSYTTLFLDNQGVPKVKIACWSAQ